MVYPYYCFSTNKGTFAGECKYAKDLGVYIFYDEKKDIFLDKDDNVIDIKGKNLFPRTGVLQAQSLVDAIYRHGGESLVKIDDYEKTLNWPNYIQTKRQNMVMSGREIIDNPEKIIDIFGTDRIFFKTKNKNYSQVIDVERLIDKGTNFYKALEAHADEDFIISDVVDIVEDEFGPLEYRGFVVNGQLLNVSRVHDFLMGRVPQNVIDKIVETIKTIDETDFPKSFVVDVFICNREDGKAFVDVLECNPIIASGTYLYNSVFEGSDSLEHDCPSISIPKEKLKYGYVSQYGFDVKNKPIPSICYELPGGFAADLISFAFFGTTSSGTMIHLDTVHNIDPANIGLIKDSGDDTSSFGTFLSSDSKLSDEELFKQLKKGFLNSDS